MNQHSTNPRNIISLTDWKSNEWIASEIECFKQKNENIHTWMGSTSTNGYEK